MPPSAVALRKAPERGVGELALIRHIRSRVSTTHMGNVRLGIGDDCAILTPSPGHEIVVTTDMSLENRHFRRDIHPAESVGHRALARGLSDLAAMGAKPLAAFLSLALPRSAANDHAWVDRFFDGLLRLAAEHGTPLAGGDTAESPADQILVDIVLLGSVPRGKALLRSGARPGDNIFVTGEIGGSAAELQTLLAAKSQRGPAENGSHPHLYPEPRIAVGAALVRRRLATACIDLSDGLSTDLMHLCEASGVSARIQAEALPIHALARAVGEQAAWEAALNGGEDYELLFTAASGVRVPRSIAGVPITRIGTISRRKSQDLLMMIVGKDGKSRVLEPRGWEHLR